MGIDAERMWAHVRYLCEDIGPRLSGTAADERTAEYIAGHFRSCGAEVEVQDYPCPSWDHQCTELALLAGAGARTLEAWAQTFTEACDVQAELAAVATRHDLEFRPDLEGRILVVHGEAAGGLALDRNPGLLAIEERRPAAALVVSPVETVSTKLVRDPFLRIPAAAVPASVGALLLASEGQVASLRIHARRYDSTGHNVIAHLPGPGPGRIVVGAHYDTAAGCVGAVDNASGTAAVLELCRVLAPVAAGPSLDLIAFGAEEYGRHLRALGSVEYVRRYPERTSDALAMVQIDSVGTTPPGPRAHVMGWPEGRRQALLRVFEGFPRYAVDDAEVLSSDHAPFYLNGVPAVAFMDAWDAIPIHTTADTMACLDPSELAHAAAAAAAVIAHVAGREATR